MVALQTNTRRSLYRHIVLILLALLLLFSATPSVGAAEFAPHERADSAVAEQSATVHIVQPGDTLTRIARRYGTTVDALKRLNGLTSDRIFVGQRLIVSGSAPNPGATVHIVQPGDTLTRIARRYGTTVDTLKRLNGLTSDRIFVGQRLIVRGSIPNPGGNYYVVQRGDTLSSLARRFGTTVAAIQAANNLRTTVIYVGQRLLMPGTSRPVTERIQFAPGETWARRTGISSANMPARYVLRAAAGQNMSVTIQTDRESAYITVLNPSGLNMAGADGPIHQWSGRLPANGDYVVEVLYPYSGDAGFILTVSIE